VSEGPKTQTNGLSRLHSYPSPPPHPQGARGGSRATALAGCRINAASGAVGNGIRAVPVRLAGRFVNSVDSSERHGPCWRASSTPCRSASKTLRARGRLAANQARRCSVKLMGTALGASAFLYAACVPPFDNERRSMTSRLGLLVCDAGWFRHLANSVRVGRRSLSAVECFRSVTSVAAAGGEGFE